MYVPSVYYVKEFRAHAADVKEHWAGSVAATSTGTDSVVGMMKASGGVQHLRAAKERGM